MMLIDGKTSLSHYQSGIFLFRWLRALNLLACLVERWMDKIIGVRQLMNYVIIYFINVYLHNYEHILQGLKLKTEFIIYTLFKCIYIVMKTFYKV